MPKPTLWLPRPPYKIVISLQATAALLSARVGFSTCSADWTGWGQASLSPAVRRRPPGMVGGLPSGCSQPAASSNNPAATAWSQPILFQQPAARPCLAWFWLVNSDILTANYGIKQSQFTKPTSEPLRQRP